MSKTKHILVLLMLHAIIIGANSSYMYEPSLEVCQEPMLGEMCTLQCKYNIIEGETAPIRFIDGGWPFDATFSTKEFSQNDIDNVLRSYQNYSIRLTEYVSGNISCTVNNEESNIQQLHVVVTRTTRPQYSSTETVPPSSKGRSAVKAASPTMIGLMTAIVMVVRL